MSVTFTFAEFVEAGGVTVLVHGIKCEHTCPFADTCEEFALYHYCDHKRDAIEECGCRAFDVNVSNANAVAILERLGYDSEWLVGEAEPGDILGRALVGNVGRDDSGMRDSVTHLPGATIIDCGRPPGYFDARLGAIVELATEAKRRGVMVAWA